MNIAILIPFRGTNTDKSRLRKEIPSSIVDELLIKMTQEVITASTSLGKKYNTYLLTKNEMVKFKGNFKVLKDQGFNLNNSIKLALNTLEEKTILIVMADLPLIRKEDLTKIVNLHIKEDESIIAPTSDDGTSLLCFNNDEEFPFVFGCNSASEYRRIFTERKIKFKILDQEKFYRDIDTLKDLREIMRFDSVPSWLKNYESIVM